MNLDVDDKEWLGQADWIIGGEQARKARKEGLYAAYIVALIAGVYGFPFIQAVFATSDRTWLRDQLASPGGILTLVVAIGAILASAYFAGRYRGPVVPPLPWTDLVLTSPIDRALALRRWWRYALYGCAFAGALLGFVMGAGLAYAHVTGVIALVVGLLLGLAVGVVTARVWLWSQVRVWPATPEWPARGIALVWRPSLALRQLHSETMRVHAANTSTLSGSIQAGNLRTARLALARPVTSGRGRRLKAGSPFAVIVRRDRLGLRRSPGSLVGGLGLSVLGWAVVLWVLTQPATPPFAAALGLMPLYLGFGAWAEGLRLQADNIGTPTLIGAPALVEAAAHLVVPVVLSLSLAGVGLGAAVALGATVSGTTVAAAVLLIALLCGGHLLASFRGSPPNVTNLQVMLIWYALPGLGVLAIGAVLIWAASQGRISPLMTCAVLVVALVAGGFAKARRLTFLHLT